jgi:hypothetical protein
MTDNIPRDGNWIEHHLMVKELMTSIDDYPLGHSIVYNGKMREEALIMAMDILDNDIPKGEDTSIGYTVVFGTKDYSMTRGWDWSKGHFSYIHDSEQSRAGIKMMAWDSPVIVDQELDHCYVGFVDSHGDQHFCRIQESINFPR